MTNEYGNELLHKVLLSAMKDIDKICRENGLRYYLYAGTLLGAINHRGFIPWDDDVDIVMFGQDFKRLYDIIEHNYSEYYKMVTFENTNDWYSKMSKIQILGAYFVDNTGKKTPVFVDISVLHSVPDSKLLRTVQRKRIEWLNLSLGVLSGAVTPSSWKTKFTIALYAKLGKEKLGNELERVLTRYDSKNTEWVGIMCNTLTRNPYTGVSGYDNDCTKRKWHDEPVDIVFEDVVLMSISDPKLDLEHRYGSDWHKPYPEEKRVTKHDVKSYTVEPWVIERLGI